MFPPKSWVFPAYHNLEVPKRATAGLDSSRVGMVIAVLQRRAGAVDCDSPNPAPSRRMSPLSRNHASPNRAYR
jgi:hypothetical protein